MPLFHVPSPVQCVDGAEAGAALDGRPPSILSRSRRSTRTGRTRHSAMRSGSWPSACSISARRSGNCVPWTMRASSSWSASSVSVACHWVFELCGSLEVALDLPLQHLERDGLFERPRRFELVLVVDALDRPLRFHALSEAELPGIGRAHGGHRETAKSSGHRPKPSAHLLGSPWVGRMLSYGVAVAGSMQRLTFAPEPRLIFMNGPRRTRKCNTRPKGGCRGVSRHRRGLFPASLAGGVPGAGRRGGGGRRGAGGLFAGLAGSRPLRRESRAFDVAVPDRDQRGDRPQAGANTSSDASLSTRSRRRRTPRTRIGALTGARWPAAPGKRSRTFRTRSAPRSCSGITKDARSPRSREPWAATKTRRSRRSFGP